MKSAIYNTDWSYMDRTDITLDESKNFFMTKIDNIMNYYAPKKIVPKSANTLGYSPWINTVLLKEIRGKDKLYKKYLQK